MHTFIDYLDEIEELKKEKSYEEAWKVANQGVIDLRKRGDESWYMMYYQMAEILKREKKYFEALEKMGFVIYYNRGVGGKSHEKFITSLLSKFAQQHLYKKYISVCENTEPKIIAVKLNEMFVSQG